MSLRLAEIQPRIVGGIPTNITQVPYFIQLLDNGKLFCSGILISIISVITSVHCVVHKQAKHLVVVAGVTYLYDRGVRNAVSKIALPKNFVKYNPNKVVAVLKLSSSINSPGIIPISMCTKTWKVDSDVHIYGCGLMHAIDIYYPKQVRTVTLKALKRSKCASWYELDIPKTTRSLKCLSG